MRKHKSDESLSTFMNFGRMVHITPALPPSINGLGDFCSMVVKGLKERGVKNNILFVRNNDSRPSDPALVVPFDTQNFYDKLLKYKPETILLHYAGYAYHPRGFPFYLVDGIKNVKRETGCRVLVYFHELYASSMSPLRSAFYTSFFQKRIIRELCFTADATFTSCAIYHGMLQDLVSGTAFKNTRTGIFSNIPEDLFEEGREKERNVMVVFGSFNSRSAVYKHKAFAEVLARLKIDTIYDIGPGQSFFRHPEVKFFVKGSLPAVEVAAFLNKAKFGALNYPPQLLGKSGIYSAYCAFGVIAVNLTKNTQPLYDGLIRNTNYFDLESDMFQIREGDVAIRKEILDWYKTHNLQAVTNDIFNRLQNEIRFGKVQNFIRS